MSTTDLDFTLTLAHNTEGFYLTIFSHKIGAVAGEVRTDDTYEGTIAQADRMIASYADAGSTATLVIPGEVEAIHRDDMAAARYQAMKAEVAAEVAAMTGEKLSEAVQEAVEYMSIAAAEHGMGAVSMGFPVGEFEPFQAPRTSEFIAQGEARLRELYPPAPAPAVTVTEDDLPF